MSALKFLLRGCVEPTMKSTSRLAYAEYLALTTCSGVAAPYAAALLWILPQHDMYPSPLPHGHSSTAAPPNPDAERFRFPTVVLVALVFFFFLAPFLAAESDVGESLLVEVHVRRGDGDGGQKATTRVVNNAKHAIRRRSSSILRQGVRSLDE